MKKYLFTLMAFTLAVGFVSAREISVDEARAIAASANGQLSTMNVASSTINLKRTLKSRKGTPLVYLFDAPQSSTYMVVSADDAVNTPLLGYGQYAGDDLLSLPPALNYWIGEYASQIEWLKAHPESESAHTRSASSSSSDLPEEVEPLLGDMAWNQSAPFYNDCPEVSGKRCVTGCVATSIAQAMRFWQYPAKGTGSFSYTWNSTTLSADFSSSTYDWSQMPYRYNSSSTSEQQAAVAKLMSDVGIAVAMNYGTSESGAMTQSSIYALVDNFGYDKGIQMIERSFYGINMWETTIKRELAAGRPVIYAGQSNEGGHQFVCDGYDADGYFHFNWGWGGMCNGYFLTTALVPQGVGIGGFAAGYNYNQSCLIGMQPSVGNSASYAMTMFGQSFRSSDAKSYNLTAEGYTFVSGEVSMDLGFLVADSITTDVDVSRVYKSKTSTLTPSIPKRESGQIYASVLSSGATTFDPVGQFNLADGTYYVAPVYKPTEDESWSILPCGMNQWVTINVANGTASVVQPLSTEVTVTSLSIPTEIKAGHTVTLNGQLRARNGEFYNSVTFMVNGASGDTISVAGSQLLDVAPNTSVDFSLKLQIPASTAAGTYSGRLIVAGQALGSSLNVTVTDGSVALNDVNFPDANLLAVVKTFDTDDDGTLSATELSKITVLNAMSKNISDATGIELLYALQQLYLDGNDLTDIDVSQLQDLIVLGLDDNMLSTIDVQSNTKLQYMRIADNEVGSLDIETLGMLQTLIISNNPIAAISLELNGALATFTANSQITIAIGSDRTVDMSQFPDMNTSNIYNLKGASLSGDTLTFDEGNDTATYSYDTGNSTLPYMPVTMVAVSASGVDTISNDYELRVDGLNVEVPTGASTLITDLAGRVVSAPGSSIIHLPAPGVYVANVNGHISKIVAR